MMKRFLIFLTAMILVSAVAFAGDDSAEGDTLKTTDKPAKQAYQKRNPDNPEIAIETDYGTMKLELFRDVAPITVDSMLSRIREKYYDGLIFHRIIDGFMIQAGNGGKPQYFLHAEFSKLKHVEGTLSMARRGNSINSASTQFFICLAAQPHLDGKYTIFGQLMDGYDVLHKIGSVETGKGDRPLKDVYIRRMIILKDAKPARPKE
jgi:peptidyl-prolyl cis-trans isomerase B (cyclophilin B)